MDRELVERAQHGDEAAFSALAVRIGDRLYAIALHVLRDADFAADAAQQALIDIWRHLPELRDPDAFQGWAYRIVIRAAYAESKRQRSWAIHAVAIDPAGATTSDASQHLVDRDQLARGFERLPVDHRAAMVLKHYLGLPNEEIAAILGVPEGTVRSRLHNSLRVLRGALEADAR